MRTLTRMLCLFNFRGRAERRRVGECQAGAGSLGGADGASHALRATYWTFAAALALSSSWVHAQTPTCAAIPPLPGCNSVTSDNAGNTAMGSGSLATIATGSGVFDSASANTPPGSFALKHNTVGNSN